MTGPLEKLDLGRRKFCLGRWLGMVAFGEVSPVLVDIGGTPTPNQKKAEGSIRREYHDTRSALDAATEIALRDDVQEVIPFLTTLAPGIAALSGWDSGSHPYLEALERRVAAFRADPFDPFGTILETARQVAAGFYEREGYGPDLPKTRCEIGLDPGDKPRSPSRPAVDGALEVRSGDTVVARLMLSAAKFWRAEICALTYATLHELVVHGFAAAHARGSVDAFAEGWMDFVAFQLHGQLKLGRLMQRSPFDGDFSTAQQGHHALVSHALRSEGKPLLETGRLAADMAQGALLQESSGDDEAREAMWAISAALNRSEVDSSRRSSLCELIEQDRAGTLVLPSFVEAARSVQAASDPAAKLAIANALVEEWS